MRNYIALSILLAGLLLDKASAGAATVRAASAVQSDEVQYEGNRMLATDEPTGEPADPPERDDGDDEDDGGGGRDRSDQCAEAGERSQECGADSDNRPEECCDDLVCDGLRCVEPDATKEDGEEEEEPETKETTDEIVGRDDICAELMGRAVSCGATNPDRPHLCCEGLVCSTDTAGFEHMRCINPDDGDDEEEEEEVEETKETCAADGIRSQQCGATRDDLPEECCDGLVCEEDDGVKCIEPPKEEEKEPEEEAAVEEDVCAADGVRSQQCGSTNTDRPEFCCDGLVCDEGSVKCIETKEEEEEEEPPAVVEDIEDEDCANEGERSQECGADNPDRPAFCCGDLVCEDGSVRCTAPPPSATAVPTPTPTEAPVLASIEAPETDTDAPTSTPTIMAPKPTAMPTTTAPTEFIMSPTDEPTPEVSILPPSSASTYATKFALTACVIVPLLLF